MFSTPKRSWSSLSLNPIQRMRRERRVALIIFNSLLLFAAVIQLFSFSCNHIEPNSGEMPPAISVEWDE